MFTWPLVLNFLPGSGTLVPGVMQEDRDQNLWNLWWVRYAVLNGHNPFRTDMIWYPTPVSLYYHTLNVFNGFLAIPLLTVFSLTTTYNIIVLFSFVMGGYGAFLLVHYICRNRWAALLGSSVFVYSAYHIATMRSLLQLISLEWVPFFVLFLLQAVFQPAWASRADFLHWLWRRGLPAGFSLFLVSLVDWYYTMYALILAGFLALYLLFRGGWDARRAGGQTLWPLVAEPLVRIGLCLAIYTVLVSPILIPMIRELRTTNYMQPAPDAAMSNSADLMTFLQPPRDQRLWGRTFFQKRRDWPYGSNRYEVYATYTALFLAAVGLFAVRRPRPVLKLDGIPSDTPETALPLPSKWFWAVCVVIFFLLALGPVLQINGAQIQWLFSPNFKLIMPYKLVEHIPLLSISRSPDRFDMPLTLCLGVLVGYGVNVLMKTWFPRLGLQRKGLLFSIAGLALLTVELAPMPYLQRYADVPRWYYQLGQQPGDFSILEMPPQDDYWHGAYRMYYQTVHHKHIFGGYISREYPHPFLTSTPGYQELQYVDGGGDMFNAARDQWLSAFALYDTRYIVLQKDRIPNFDEPPQDVSPSRKAIKLVLGQDARPEYSDDQLEAYRVPLPAARVPFLSVGDGWEPRERNEQGMAYRWLHAEGTLRIDSPDKENDVLTFRAASLGKPRRLVIYHGDHVVFDGVIGTALTAYRTSGPLGLPQGTSTLRFVCPDGTSSPAELGMGDDPRQLSIVFSTVGLEQSK